MDPSKLNQAVRLNREVNRLSQIKDSTQARNYAATKIQAQFRRNKQAREALNMKRQFTRNAQRIQRFWKQRFGG